MISSESFVQLLFRATEKVAKRSRAFEKRGKQFIFYIPVWLQRALGQACLSHFAKYVTVGVNKNVTTVML